MINDEELEPCGRMVLVELDDKSESRSKGGIILPDSAKNPLEKATVLASGPGLVNEETGKRIPTDVAKNDRVLVPRFCGTDFKYEGKNCRLIPAPEIVARLKAKPTPKPVTRRPTARISTPGLTA